MLPKHLLRFRTPIVFVLHLTLVPLGYFAAFALRFDLPVPQVRASVFWSTVVFLIPLRMLSFSIFGLYHGWWRHVGMQDLVDLIKAVTLSSALLIVALFMTGGLESFPRSVLVLDWVIAIFLFGGARFSVRAIREGSLTWSRGERRGNPALVVGAGEAAERLVRQLRHGGGDFRIVGLVDDALEKRGMRLHGVPVLGTTHDLPLLATETGATLIVIAIPSATREEMKRIVAACMKTKVEFKIVPRLVELLDGRARVNQLRRVELEDLLGRETVVLNFEELRHDLRGKVVLVTGGAGSIGAELARQIANLGPAQLILLDQAESPLYFTQLDLARMHPELDTVPVVADVTDSARVEHVFAKYRPHYVFHAAAYKHVPMMELHVGEAVRNNVFGTLHVASFAARYGASKFVLISTDKAVHPSSVMGATKRVAERIVLGWPSLRNSATDFRAVRFGNVLGSDGSVVPLFKRQLAAGEPLTVTHPDVTRYFMTIQEAVQLVLQAALLPEAARRISMLDMGEPVRVLDLAENLVSLSGLEPYKDVPIVFTGLRPGEKLHEELMTAVEETVPTTVQKIRVVQTDETDGALIEMWMDRVAADAAVGNAGGLLTALAELVPECAPSLRKRGEVLIESENRQRLGPVQMPES